MGAQEIARPGSRVLGAKGWGYIGRDGSPCLQYCHNCQLENYAMNIPTGRCTWCAAGPSEPVHGHHPAPAPETPAG